MAFQRRVITDFSAGEVGKKFYGRFDLDIYSRGCQKLENWIVDPRGLITTRPGTKYLGETSGNATGRLIPFVVGANAFEVELTALKIRIWQGDTLLSITPADPIVTTYTAAHIPYIQYCKVNNQLFLVHRGYAIKVLTWTGGVNFTFTSLTITFGTDIPAWVALTAYAEGDVVTNGTPMKIYICITAGTSAGAGGPTTEADDITDGTVHWSWQFTKPFSQAGDYPGCINYFNGRMCFAGSTNKPDTGWMSQPYDFGNFDYFALYTYTGLQLKPEAEWANPLVPETEVITYTQTVVGDGSAIEYQLAGDNDESIMWICGSDCMVIGTATSEWVVSKDVTALNIDQCVHMRSRLGSSEQQAIVPMQNPVFLQGTLSKAYLWEYAYNSENAELDSVDLTYLSDHMLASGVTQMDFVSIPQPMWIGVTAGNLAILLYSKKYRVAAWFWFVTDGTILSFCVIPGTTDDAIYLIVLRNSRYCMERIEKIWEETIPMLDSYYYVASAPASTTGLARFNGETVWVYNQTHGTWRTGVVAAGALDTNVDLGDAIWIGLPYTCSMQSLPLQTYSSITGGSGQGQLKRIMAVSARVIDSFPFKAGYSQTLNLEPAAVINDAAWTAKASGDVRIPFQGTWSKEGYLWIIQDLRQKTTILDLFPEVDG